MANHCDLEVAKAKFTDLCKTIAKLRDPETGCPWDLKQTHESLRKYMIEEAYEAAEAMTTGDRDQIVDELGDVLLQVILNAQLGHDQGDFNITDVIDNLNQKMIRRHPHVFDPTTAKIGSDEQLHKQWQEIKQNEKNQESKDDIFQKLPPSPLMQADEIGKQSKKIHFDWDKPEQVFKKLKSEVTELEEALNSSKFKPDHEVYTELGDVFFTLAQVCRHLGYSSELVSMDGNKKFLTRFALMTKLMNIDGVDAKTCDAESFEKYWRKAKNTPS